jgi:hypothetical protein
MTPVLLLVASLAVSAPALVIVPPAEGVADVDAYALSGRAASVASPLVDGEVVVAAPPAASCDVACRLRSAAATGAARVIVLQGSHLLDVVQVGALAFELPRNRMTAQCSERIHAVDVVAASARCVRAVLGKAQAGDASAAAAARAGPTEGAAPVRVVVAPVLMASTITNDEATRNALGSRAAAIVAREPGFVAVSTADVAAVLANEANRSLVGADASKAYEAATRALDARLLLRVDVGAVGDAVVVSASLIDVTLDSASPQRADVIVEDASEIPEAIDVVVLQLFGRPARVPPPPRVRRSRFEAGMHALVPGGGQFWNGPEHAWKGVLVAAGTATGVVGGGALVGAGWFTYDQRKEWDTGTAKFVENACDVDDGPCARERDALASTASTLQWAGWATVGAGVVVWGAGIVEAVVAAE